MKKKILLNFIPILFYLLCFLILRAKVPFLSDGIIPYLEILVGILGMPIYLVWLNQRYVRPKALSIIVTYVYIILIDLVGIALSFFNWWFPGKITIDIGTIMILRTQIVGSLLLITISWIIVMLLTVWKKRGNSL